MTIDEIKQRLNTIKAMNDFEDSYSDKVTYCLFIAPRLHQDTIETFWMATKYGYKGATQRIVPLSIQKENGGERSNRCNRMLEQHARDIS